MFFLIMYESSVSCVYTSTCVQCVHMHVCANVFECICVHVYVFTCECAFLYVFVGVCILSDGAWRMFVFLLTKDVFFIH